MVCACPTAVNSAEASFPWTRQDTLKRDTLSQMFLAMELHNGLLPNARCEQRPEAEAERKL
jgi:hypothetical protein